MTGTAVSLPMPLPAPLPATAKLASGLVPDILLELPTEQQLETLYSLATFVIETLQAPMQHRIGWDFPAASVNVGTQRRPENYFILTGGGSNFFADQLISCPSKAHCTVNGALKSTDGLAPHLFLYLARKWKQLSTPAARRAALICMLSNYVTDPQHDARLRRFFDPNSLTTSECKAYCWTLPWLVRLETPTCQLRR